MQIGDRLDVPGVGEDEGLGESGELVQEIPHQRPPFSGTGTIPDASPRSVREGVKERFDDKGCRHPLSTPSRGKNGQLEPDF
jgi:hypothetical protein